MRRIGGFAALVLLLSACTSSGGSGPTPTLTPPPSSNVTTPISTPVTTPPVTTPVTTPTTSKPPATPTVPADVPTTGPNAKPGEKPPLMPVLATQHTPAGAAAFAKFFMLTVDWGYATVSPTYLRHYTDASCVACRFLIDGIGSAKAAGHRYIGGRSIISGSAPGKGGALRMQVVTLDRTSFEELTQSGKFVSADPTHRNSEWMVGLKWTRSGWAVISLAVQL